MWFRDEMRRRGHSAQQQVKTTTKVPHPYPRSIPTPVDVKPLGCSRPMNRWPMSLHETVWG